MVRCEVCNVSLTSAICMPQHVQGRQHRQKIGTEILRQKIREMEEVIRSIQIKIKHLAFVALCNEGKFPTSKIAG